MQRREGPARLYYVDAQTAGLAGGRDREGGTAATEPDPAAAVTDLFRAHHLDLVRLALMLVGDVATAEDVVQDAFERLHSRWHRLRDPASGLAYARSSVLNGCRSVHRHAAMSRRHAAVLAQPPAGSQDGAAAADDRGMLATALRGLPRRQREVLVLRYYCDLDIAEIAATLRIGSSAVRSTMSRGLAALARIVERSER
jgi:RNA polymerase sigma-70 factor (sigma-E family)